jgi:hypothetical protein
MRGAGHETILIVDDEPLLRSMCETILSHYGYRVLAASDGEDAIYQLSGRPELAIDLAVVDVIMPAMSGPELAIELDRLRPGMTILFVTGYPDEFAGLIERGQTVLRKPFTSDALISTIRELLDAASSRPRE